MCGFEGTVLTDKVRELVATGKIGGIIYFARNVESPEQVARLTASLQRAALEGGTPPLFISIDQEGGMVARVTEGVALMPGGMAIAAAGSEADAYEAAFVSGNELAAMGINLNYAPVMDVNNNADNPVIGVRSFGELPQRVVLISEWQRCAGSRMPVLPLRRSIFPAMAIPPSIPIWICRRCRMIGLGWSRWNWCRSDGQLLKGWMP